MRSLLCRIAAAMAAIGAITLVTAAIVAVGLVVVARGPVWSLSPVVVALAIGVAVTPICLLTRWDQGGGVAVVVFCGAAAAWAGMLPHVVYPGRGMVALVADMMLWTMAVGVPAGMAGGWTGRLVARRLRVLNHRACRLP